MSSEQDAGTNPNFFFPDKMKNIATRAGAIAAAASLIFVTACEREDSEGFGSIGRETTQSEVDKALGEIDNTVHGGVEVSQYDSDTRIAAELDCVTAGHQANQVVDIQPGPEYNERWVEGYADDCPRP